MESQSPNNQQQSELIENKPYPSNKFQKKSILFIFFIITVILIIFGLIFIFNATLKNKRVSNNPTNLQIENNSITTKPSILSQPNNVNYNNSILVYTDTIYTESLASNIHFYNMTSQQKIATPPILKQGNNFWYDIGPWSPNGHYLPILQFVKITQNKNLYLFDSQTLEIKKIYSDLGKNIDTGLPDHLDFSTSWIDNSRFVIGQDYNNSRDNFITLKYITVNGRYELLQQPDVIKLANKQLEYITDIKDGSLISFNIGNDSINFKPKGTIIGVVNGMLVSIDKPSIANTIQQTNLPNIESLSKQMEEYQKQGLSEEEITVKMKELLEPKGETLIYLYSILDGKLLNKINITDGVWKVQSILVHPSEKYLIAHQADKELDATKHRFIKITPSNAEIQIIYQENLPKFGNENYTSLLMYQQSSFFISGDGKWIVSMTGSNVNQPENSIIFMINIDTKEKKIICNMHCRSVRIYDPYLLQVRSY